MDCKDLEALVTPYVDGEVTPAQCAAIEAHLSACPDCRRCADAESKGRAVVRRCRDTLRAPAPASLHAKCRKLAADHATLCRLIDELSPQALLVAKAHDRVPEVLAQPPGAR